MPVMLYKATTGAYIWLSVSAKFPDSISALAVCTGEHIDYHGYAVLPMAIEQDIVCAVATNKDGVIRLSNISKDYQ